MSPDDKLLNELLRLSELTPLETAIKDEQVRRTNVFDERGGGD